jgi:hypothetical protein
MTSKRQPYQAPELILLGGSAKDTGNLHSKAHFNAEVTVSNTHGWNHLGPQGQTDTLNENYALLRTHTQVIS